MFRSILVSIFVFALAISPVFANWITTLDDDLFSEGKTARMFAIEVGSGIVVECDAERNISISYVVESPQAAELAGTKSIPGELVLKADTGKKWTAPTHLYQHNTTHLGFEFEDKSKTREIVKELGKANAKVLVGLKIETVSENATFSVSASGSTKAVDEFLKYCPRE